MSDLIILVGFMGSGKSTIGKKLANALGYAFYDLDQIVAERIGMSIPEYFEKFGEPAFREQEKNALETLSQFEKVVLATGGGTPCFFDNMELLNNAGTTVYLKLHPKTLQKRLNQKNVSKRPVLQGLGGEELLRFIQIKLREREVYYNKAKIIVDQISVSPQELAKRVLAYHHSR